MKDRLNLIQFGWFSTHSKFQLPWKVDCDALNDDDVESLGKLIRWKFAFGNVYGVPRGGTRLAEVLRPHIEDGYPPLIVDDVLTTGRSMEQARFQVLEIYGQEPIGVVVFSRGRCPSWVWPIFTVNEWAQSRATGLG